MEKKGWEVAQGNSSKMGNLEDAGLSAGYLAGLPTGCAVIEIQCFHGGEEISCLPLSYLPSALVSSQGLVLVAP